MGVWTTLHLFSDTIFNNHVVPSLRGRKEDLFPHYRHNLSFFIRGTENMSDQEKDARTRAEVKHIHYQAPRFNAVFDDLPEFSMHNAEDRQDYIHAHPELEDFTNFFEYYIFNSCADLYPYILGGKYSLRHRISSSTDIGKDLLAKLDRGYGKSVFSIGSTGIVSWLTADETELLYLDKPNIITSSEEFRAAFFLLLDVAVEHKLGLLLGADLSEWYLKKLPGFKLVTKDQWQRYGGNEKFVFEDSKL